MTQGDNLTDADRAKGGQQSHQNQHTTGDTSSTGMKGGSVGQNQNTSGNPGQHEEAGKIGETK